MAVDELTRKKREETVRTHMEAENALDLEAALATFARPRYELIGTHRVYDGADEVRRYFRESRNAFPDQRNELIAMYHADDAVVTEFWLMGTHLGEFDGFPPTGKAFRCRMAAFFLFEGADLVCERIYFDAGTIARQLA
ncbi:MAG TPA: ester cyclase [Acidimicrobiales bacterium]|nr:ester cyclase [Acidimicrobiales bacterium]